jgi:hypothetical protein
MKLQISEQILNDTTRCRKNFICLTEIKSLCKIKYCLSGKSFIIKPEKHKPCSYMVFIENVVLCSCPIRKEIYKKYNV